MDDMDMDMHNNTNANRAFLQAVFARGSLTAAEAKPIIAAIFQAEDPEGKVVNPDDVSKQQVDCFIAAVTESLAPFDYHIRTTQHQTTRQRIYAVVNTHSDPATQLATMRTPDELSFLKRLLDAMFDINNTPRLELMAVQETDALNLRKPTRNQDEDGENPQEPKTSDKGLTMDEAERVTENLIGEGWVEKSPRKYLTLAPRALMELRSWLVETFNDPNAGPNDWQRIKFCVACKELVTRGQRCASRECNVRIHEICQDAYFRARRDGKCPKCATDWDGSHYVGERAVGRDRNIRQSAGGGGSREGRNTQASTQTRSRGPVSQEKEKEEDDDDESDDESSDG